MSANNNNKNSEVNKSNGAKTTVSVRVDAGVVEAFESKYENKSEALRDFIESVALGDESESDIETEIQTVSTEIDEVEQRIEDLESKLDTAQSKRDSLQQRKQVLEQRLSDVQERESELEERVEELVERWEMTTNEPVNDYYMIAGDFEEVSGEDLKEMVRSRKGGDSE